MRDPGGDGGLANIWLIWSIGRTVFGGSTPLIAAVMAASYGSFMFMESKLMSTTLALTLGLVLMHILHVERRSVRTLWLGLLPFGAITSLAIVGFLQTWRRGFSPPALLLALFVAANWPWC